MPISSTTRKAGPFTGNDSAAEFPFSFKVFQDDELRVVRVRDGYQTTLTLDSDYTVALNEDQEVSPGGTVTLIDSSVEPAVPVALATGDTLTIASSVQQLQSTDLTNQGGFYPEVITAALDKQTILIQQVQEELDRSLKYPISDPEVGSEITVLSARANKVLGFDENGAPMALTVSDGALQGPAGTVTLGTVETSGAEIAITNSGTPSAAVLNFTFPVREYLIVDGSSTYPKTHAGIQQAIDDVAEGGMVFLPAGTYAINDTITIDKAIKLVGCGDSTFLQVNALLAADKDIILVQPSSAWLFNLQLRDFFINPSSGTPGRYAIHFDGTNGTADQATLEHLRIGELGSYAIFADGTGAGNGMPRIARIKNSIITGGIKFENAGDTIEISHNMIDGPRAALDVDFQSGASTLLFERNNIPALGGVRIGGSAVAAHIFHNEFETVAGFTGSNGAFVDIDGTAGAPSDGVLVRDNSFQIVNGVSVDGLRVNYANSTIIEGNRFYRGATTSKDVNITVNATNTQVGKNTWVSGGPITSMVADASPSTSYDFFINDERVMKNNTSLTQLDESGTQRSIFRTGNEGSVYFYGFHGTALARGSMGANYFYDGDGAAVLTLIGGKARLASVPEYADNAAAIAGGLSEGDVYRTASGVLMVRY